MPFWHSSFFSHGYGCRRQFIPNWIMISVSRRNGWVILLMAESHCLLLFISEVTETCMISCNAWCITWNCTEISSLLIEMAHNLVAVRSKKKIARRCFTCFLLNPCDQSWVPGIWSCTNPLILVEQGSYFCSVQYEWFGQLHTLISIFWERYRFG